MSNNTTLNSELFQNLLVQSQYAMYENSIARAVATVFDYPTNAGKVVSVPIWAGLTAQRITDEAAASAAGANTNSKTINLVEHVVYSRVTDMLRDSAQESVITALANQSGLALAEAVDKELIGLFTSSDITQSVGTANSDNTVSDLMKAAAILRANKHTGPMFAVVNPRQAFGIKSALTATNNYQNSSALASDVLGQYFVGTIAGITILEHASVGIDVDGDAVGCVFAPAAFGLAQRGGISMEEQRQAAARATDLVLTAVAGAGILRPEMAVKLLGDAVL